MKKVFIVLLVIISFGGVAFCAQAKDASAQTQLSLSQAINIALNNNPSIKAAKDNLTAADGKLGQAFGALLPNLSVTGSIGSMYQDPQALVGELNGSLVNVTTGTQQTAVGSNYHFTLSQPIYTGGRLTASLDIAQANYDVAKESLKKTQYDITYNVVTAYYGALQAQKLFDLSKESLDMANSHLKQVTAMSQAGTSTQADVLRDEVQVSNMEVAVKRASNALDIAKDAFNNALGVDLDSPVVLSEKELVHEIVQPKTFAECMATVFDTQPDWIIFQLNKKMSGKNVGIQYSGYYPMISLVGVAGNQTETYPSYPGNFNTNSWSITANGSWTLFDGMYTPSKIKEAQAEYDALVANEEGTRNMIILDLKDACLNVVSAVDVIKSASKGVESAEENYKISKEKYANGIGSNLEMLDAQTSFKQAKTDLYQAQYDYQIAKAKVNQVMGVELYTFFAKENK